MAAPAPSQLDYGQVLQGSYDEANGRLRVDAAITAPIDMNGEVLVDIRAEDGDSVLLTGTSDGTPSGSVQYVKVNPDGSFNVDATIVSSTNTAVVSQFNSITSVPSGSLVTILTHTTAAGKNDFLSKIEVSGTNIAQFDVYINSVLSARQRSYFGGALNCLFDFEISQDLGLKTNPGDIIEVKVIHNRPDLGDFEARLLYAE